MVKEHTADEYEAYLSYLSSLSVEDRELDLEKWKLRLVMEAIEPTEAIPRSWWLE